MAIIATPARTKFSLKNSEPKGFAPAANYAIVTDVAAIAQLVERIHGKDEVSGSSPDRGSIFIVNFMYITLCRLPCGQYPAYTQIATDPGSYCLFMSCVLLWFYGGVWPPR